VTAKAYLEPDEVVLLEGGALAYDRKERKWKPCLMYQLLIRLLFRLGCRVSEVLGIAVDDIDFRHKRVTIQHLKTRVKLSCPDCGVRLSRTSKFCPGCGARVEKAVASELEHRRQRALPVDDDTLEMLREYIEAGGPVSTNGKQLLFGIDRRHAWHIVRECAVRAKLGMLVNPETGEAKGISPHRLRDAFAVNAVKKDDSADSLRMLQEMLGHKSIETTMRYRKVAGEELEKWYQGLWGTEGGKADGEE
jgi:integrase/recombinase XerD